MPTEPDVRETAFRGWPDVDQST